MERVSMLKTVAFYLGYPVYLLLRAATTLILVICTPLLYLIYYGIQILQWFLLILDKFEVNSVNNLRVFRT